MNNTDVRVIGAGLAGSEAALQLASFGLKVELCEMKPFKKTPAQKLDGPAELVCSNSFRSTKKTNAVALLKDEMLMLNSFLIKYALEARVPAGDCLSVDREVLSNLVKKALNASPNIEIKSQEILKVPTDNIPTIIATGPLTSDSLARDLINKIGQESLDFYDAISPIIDSESIDMTKAFKQNRWQESHMEGDYINCPMDKATYELFIERIKNSERTKAHIFENKHFFEGCLPIEIMAERGLDTLRFGPLKPVGLTDTNSNEKPHAVLQLRKEDIFGSSYNMVGCQTRMTIPEQKEIFAIIPALRKAKFLRYGSIHRNTYVDAPNVLDEYFRIKNLPNIYLAGQITGVEGYVESIAMGLIVSHIVKDHILGKNNFRFFPKETALGGLCSHVSGYIRANKKSRYTPSNITWAMMPPLENLGKKKPKNKKELLYNRAIDCLKDYLSHENKTD